MNIRKFWRLSCLTVASLFWASCSDSNSEITAPQIALPDSSSSESSSSVEKPVASSSDAVDEKSSPSSSSSEKLAMSSSNVESSAAVASSASPESSANAESSASPASSASVESSASPVQYVLARDPSVTCEETTYQRSNCPEPSYSPTCNDYKKYLGKDTTVSEKLLTSWIEKLASCGVVREPEPVYGVISSPVCYPSMFYDAPMFKCSNNMTYKDYKLEGNLVYTSSTEYDEAHGIFPEDLVKSCKQDEFALFTDILTDVQKKLYEVVSGRLMEDIARPEAEQKYLESLLDRENKTLKGPFSPYLPADYQSDSWLIKEKSSAWFTGYVAKTTACEGGAPATTEIYQQKYDAILAECLEIIEKNSKNASK